MGKEPDLEKWREEREHWNTLALKMPDLLPTSSTQHYRRSEIALIKRHFGPLKGKRVLKLDLWNEALNTRILNWMSSQGAETVGLDFSRVVTSLAHKNSKGQNEPMHLIEADIRRLPFQDSSFDFIYTVGTIEHIDEYAEALKEIQRVLKEGGRSIIGVPYKWDIFLRPLLVRTLDLFGKYPYSPEKAFGAREFRGVVEESGLRVLHRTGLLAFPGILRMAELYLYKRDIPLYRVAPFLIRNFHLMEELWGWVRQFGYLIALVAEKEAC
jgi:SAM-dependent methyltransferase